MVCVPCRGCIGGAEGGGHRRHLQQFISVAHPRNANDWPVWGPEGDSPREVAVITSLGIELFRLAHFPADSRGAVGLRPHRMTKSLNLSPHGHDGGREAHGTAVMWSVPNVVVALVFSAGSMASALCRTPRDRRNAVSLSPPAKLAIRRNGGLWQVRSPLHAAWSTCIVPCPWHSCWGDVASLPEPRGPALLVPTHASASTQRVCLNVPLRNLCYFHPCEAAGHKMETVHSSGPNVHAHPVTSALLGGCCTRLAPERNLCYLHPLPCHPQSTILGGAHCALIGPSHIVCELWGLVHI